MMRFLILFIAFVTVYTPSYAENKQIPETRQQVIFSYAPLVKKASPAVVNIYTKLVVEQRTRAGFNPFLEDPFFQQFFGRQFRGTPLRKRIESTLGSGVIVSNDGMIITNAHVVKNAKEIVVVLSDGEEFKARVVMVDERTDMAVLSIDNNGQDLSYLELSDSDKVEVGDIVLAIGNPFGVGQTVTSGIVSATSRTASGVSDFNFFIQTDAAINPGNSGGALIDMNGKLIGVNSAIYSKSGGSMGIGFAIPANMVRVVLHAASTNGKITRSWFGVSAQAITKDIADSLGMQNHKGALVIEVHKASPARKAGLKAGDVVRNINGYAVEEPAELRFRSAMVEVGQSIALDVLRNGKIIKISFIAVEAPEDTPRNTTELKGSHPFSGVVVENLSPAVANEIKGIDMYQTGVVVSKIKRYGRLNLQKGDIIQKVNGVKITNIKKLKKVLSNSAKYWNILILRGKQIINITVSG